MAVVGCHKDRNATSPFHTLACQVVLELAIGSFSNEVIPLSVIARWVSEI